jgi:hypothetical protein
MLKVSIFLAVFFIFGRVANAFDLGVSGAGGYVNFKTNEHTEISKKGGTAILLFEVGMPILILRLRAAGGMLGISARGARDGTNETVRHIGYLASVGSDVILLNRFGIGPSLVYHIGKGASLRFEDQDKTRSVIYVGGRASYRMANFTSLRGKEADLSIFAEYLHDINIKDTSIAITSVGLGLHLP